MLHYPTDVSSAVRNRAMLGFVAPLKAPPTVSSAEGMSYVNNFSTGLTVSIGNKSFFNLELVKEAQLTDDDSEKLLNSLGFASQADQGSNALRRNSPGIIKAAHMSNHLYEATVQNVNIGKMPGVFRGNLPPRSLFENNLPELLISMNALVRQKDGNFIVDPSLITFEGVKNFYYSKYAQQSPEGVYGKVSVTGGVEFNTLTRGQADKARDEVNERGSSEDQRIVDDVINNAIIEDDPRMMGAMVVPEDVREERLETIGEGAKQFGSTLIGVAATKEEQERARELTELIQSQQKQ